MVTTSIKPPNISFKFNKYLLSDFLQISKFRYEDILTLSKKNIRSQDVGKRKKFDQLLKEYQEVYVRKEIEKNEFEEKIKDKIKKRSDLSITEGYM